MLSNGNEQKGDYDSVPDVNDQCRDGENDWHDNGRHQDEAFN